ncbi:palindromic element RPE4 domain-containing protein [Rickettsia tamurae]|nr:palindromic element RPE4 domain-containing protein [Rickettsia tamurae]
MVPFFKGSVSPHGLTTGSIKKLKRLDTVVKPRYDNCYILHHTANINPY